jgi:hypothetical protein
LIGWQIDNKAQGTLSRSLFCRTYDIFFGIPIEIALVKGRWVERVKQLTDAAEV